MGLRGSNRDALWWRSLLHRVPLRRVEVGSLAYYAARDVQDSFCRCHAGAKLLSRRELLFVSLFSTSIVSRALHS
jgi:hypothetical protein